MKTGAAAELQAFVVQKSEGTVVMHNQTNTPDGRKIPVPIVKVPCTKTDILKEY